MRSMNGQTLQFPAVIFQHWQTFVSQRELEAKCRNPDATTRQVAIRQQ